MGRGKPVIPPPPLDAPSPRALVRESLNPVELAVRQFEHFVNEWTPRALRTRTGS